MNAFACCKKLKFVIRESHIIIISGRKYYISHWNVIDMALKISYYMMHSQKISKC